ALHLLSAGTYFWNIKAIEYLLGHGVDIEARDSYGKTPLMIAVCSDECNPSNGFWKEETVRILLERGANPNVLDSEGRSCLNMAGHANVTRMLLDYGADIKLGTPFPLALTVANLDVDAAELLLKAGADPKD
ncbi:ankyrin repeat-containing domain protein, partial [Rhexocercosporidium sp. MPI-PUGE-AT-0058]